MTAQLKSWAAALGGAVSGGQILCPGPRHSATDRSLSVKIGHDDEPIVHSFAGDDPIACKDYVRAKLGQPKFMPNGHAKPAKKTYFTYHDETGTVVYQVERTDYYDGRKKKFSQRRPDPARPGEWLWNLGGVRPVPYRLPELLEALAHDRTIIIVEGEAKADLLWSWNIPATCNSGGAEKWREEHSAYLSGADAVVLPDNDAPGRLHLDSVARSLKEAGASVRIVDLPGLGAKGDVIDWAAAGGTREQFDALIENEARPWAPSGRESVNAKPKGAGSNGETFLIKASEIAPEPVSWLWKYWLARGKLHIIAGAPGSGKTTIYLSFAAIISSGATWPDGTRAKAGNVVIWTSEDGHADTIIPRLTRMGADLDRVFIVRSQREANGKTRAFNPSTDMESLREKAATISGGIDFVFLDPVVSAVPVTRNSDKNAETRAGLTPFVEFIETLNAAGGGVTHVSKGTAGKDPLERVTGTLAYGAVPRIVLVTSIDALKQTLQTGYPDAKANISISSQLVAPQDNIGYYPNLRELNGYLRGVSHQILTGKKMYPGVGCCFQKGEITVHDGTSPPGPKMIKFSDLIGQPTWIAPFTIQIKTVMRGDLKISDQIKLPPTRTLITEGAQSGLNTPLTFQGTFLIYKLRHIGNFRQADGAAWVTVVDALLQPGS